MRRSNNGIRVEAKAERGKEMTLAELAQFVADARNVGIGDLARIKTRITFGGGIKAVTVASGDIVPARDRSSMDRMD